MEAWRQWLLGGRKTFVPEKKIHLTPTGLLIEGDFTQNPEVGLGDPHRERVRVILGCYAKDYSAQESLFSTAGRILRMPKSKISRFFLGSWERTSLNPHRIRNLNGLASHRSVLASCGRLTDAQIGVAR
jgi:hypothetical protein